MTAFNIRRNVSNLLYATATAVYKMKMPEAKAIKDTLDNARVNIAKAVVPNDKAFVIPRNK